MGLEQGLEQGKKIGYWEQRVIIIQKMCSGGTPAGQIAAMLDMEKEEVESVIDLVRRHTDKSPEQIASMMVDQAEISAVIR